MCFLLFKNYAAIHINEHIKAQFRFRFRRNAYLQVYLQGSSQSPSAAQFMSQYIINMFCNQSTNQPTNCQLPVFPVFNNRWHVTQWVVLMCFVYNWLCYISQLNSSYATKGFGLLSVCDLGLWNTYAIDW